MKQIVYKPLFIKSEADLPKEDGYYFCGVKYENGAIADLEHFNLNDKEIINSWLNDIDWYLQPVELPSDEDIKNEGFLYAKRVQTVFDNEIWAFKAGMKLMRDKLINK